MVRATPHAANAPFDVYYATDCLVTSGPDGLDVRTTLPIASGADEAALWVERLRWATFVRYVTAHHTAAVAMLALGRGDRAQ
jgi:hypothetical protein